MSAVPITTPEPPADAVTIEVDGKKLKVAKGTMIIQATDAAGIYIPRFCYHSKLAIAANCRMCLIEVEKSPKPLPACATPVMEGMKVFTRSALARDAQKGVMEFLLINHPLDCPICDQGGECPLQDQALGYGKDASRFDEGKRVVPDKDIGPLIATFMTRCIHCTRCVRFGQEIAGVMEFGALGRGEHMEIRTFLDTSIDSELSGNVIDICPVGALTSKPFLYTGRPWELDHHASISPHDCLGTPIDVQTLRGKVMRVLPRTDESLNECWLADRDRFSYEALNSAERLLRPMIKRDGQWEETDWPTALEFTANGLRRVLDAHGPDGLGALASPTATLEEFYLLQKLVRAAGSHNVDHRLRQIDVSDDGAAALFPSLGRSIASLEKIDAALLIGAWPRKDQPLIGHRLRKSQRRGARIMAINPVDYEFTYPLAAKVITDPHDLVVATAEVLRALRESRPDVRAASWVDELMPRPAARAIAELLATPGDKAIALGNYAQHHPHAATLRALARLIADASGATVGVLSEANAAGAWLAGCVPHRGPGGHAAGPGRGAHAMLREPRAAYLLYGVEPELDALEAAQARAAMEAAEFVVSLNVFRPSAYRNATVQYADVCLPLAPFTEIAGTFVNVEGRPQTFEAALKPAGEARPGWKILRVLANHLGLAGFEQQTLADVRAEIEANGVPPQTPTDPPAHKQARLPEAALAAPVLPPGALTRINEVPIYAVDGMVRRAPALSRTADNPPPAARVNAATAANQELNAGQTVRARMSRGEARLKVVVDARVPDGCVLIAAGYPETVALDAHGPVSLVRVP